MSIKIIDRFILMSFLRPFLVSFACIHFLFFIQFTYHKVGYLIGKGLEITLIIKLLSLFLIILVPLVIPLAILLASLMTFGSLGEHSELTAIKSSGLSLIRIIRPIAILVTFLTLFEFLFSEYVITYAHLKTWSLLYDIKRKKRELQFQNGIFYTDIPYYRIRIQDQNKKTNVLNNIIIYDHTARMGNDKLITSKRGKMEIKKDLDQLVMTLDSGYSFTQEKIIKNIGSAKTRFTRSQFNKAQFNFNLEDFGLKRTDEDLFKSHNLMSKTNEIWIRKDSLRRLMVDNKSRLVRSILDHFNILQLDTALTVSKMPAALKPNFYNNKILFPTIETAFSQLPSLENMTTNYKDSISYSEGDILGMDIELSTRHANVLLILIMFFIGAPLGAVIKKGGLGFPVIVGILFFMVNYILTTNGKKYAREAVVDPYLGIWFANAFLAFFAILLMLQAKKDSRLFEVDYYWIIVKNRLRSWFGKKASAN